MEERVKSFLSRFPKSHLCIVNGHLEGVWIVGNTFRGSYSGGYYGCYPHSYLERVLSIFPDLKPFHLFSGMVEDDWALDINPNSKASVIGDAHHLPIKSESLELIVADPPYTKEDARKYGFPMVKKTRVLQECWRVLRDGGFLVWLDLTYPQIHYKDLYNFKLYGLIAVVVSTQHRIRQCTILQKKPISAGGEKIGESLPA
ncbi:MAG: hypothetical protein JRE40_11055 [Deltaproteobacteria bacterium]|nr:hypothetical protein [Deltaproteobacteria bacterium]MBW2674355.1 hypothetical protein [Deltaproteobacteria bacterium]